jgi:muramoyltetrapeptide carboxypeptidase LdcA involved in peptidoglycan recycling
MEKIIKIIPEKLKEGDEIRVIAPSQSLAIISEEIKTIALERFFEINIQITFGENAEEKDETNSSRIDSRIKDLHQAFSDPKVKGILTVLGGFNSNQLLDYLDWELIKKNPKIFCGFADITALNNAIFQKTGLVNYSGPDFSTFGQRLYFEYTLEYFKKCLFLNYPFYCGASKEWSDDSWFLDQNNRSLTTNSGLSLIKEGEAEGTIVGGNLSTFRLLQGTQYFPSLEGTILFIEEDGEIPLEKLDRDLQSLIHLPDFKGVKGMIFGRFQRGSSLDEYKIKQLVDSKKELANLPMIAGVDFGHTDPKITFPIGGKARIKAYEAMEHLELEILEH